MKVLLLGGCGIQRKAAQYDLSRNASDKPVKGLPGRRLPLEMVAKLLEPQLQYNDSKKDLCVMVNKV